MALIKCHECGNEVSTEAAACPHCGAKPQTENPQAKSKAVLQIVGAVATLGAVIAFLTNTSSSPPSVIPQASTSGPSSIQESRLPVGHNYSYAEGGEYGYERGLSEDDAKAGHKAAPMIMVRYLGKHGDTYRWTSTSGPSKIAFSCKEPCDFAKSTTYFAGYQGAAETLRVIDGTVLWAIVADIRAGQLAVATAPPQSE